MAQRSKIKIRHSYTSTYPLTAQRNWVGAQSTAGRRGFWNDLTDPDGTCLATHLDSNRYLYYAAGAYLKKRDILLGTSSTIATVSGSSATINAIHTDGTYVYIGGAFTTVAATSRNNVARFNKTSGAIDSSWNPNCNDLVAWITGDPDGNGSATYMGGYFTDVNSGTTRNRAACFNGSGTATSWNPNLNGYSYAGEWVELGTTLSAETIIMAGAFTTVGGTGRSCIAEIDTSGAGTLTSWNPNVTGGTPDVRSLLVDSTNGVVYFGGQFTTVGGTTRNRCAGMTYDGGLTAFNPNVSTTAGHTVLALADVADHIYMGGNFTTVGGTARVDVAKVSKADGTLQAFYPPLAGGTNVYALATFERTVYVGTDHTGVNPCYPVLQGGSYGSYLNAFPDPLFTDSNTYFVTKAGADTNAGTYAAPFLTIEKGRSSLAGAFVYVCVADSGEYGEALTWSVASTGLWALDGYAPTIKPKIGATPGTYGARASGRLAFSTGAAGTFYYVAKSGNDSTGARGNSALPFKTIQAALSDGSRVDGDTVQIQDNGTYTEDLSAGSLTVTIQAKDGKTPTLVNVLTGATDYHITISNGETLTLYGLNIRSKRASLGAVFNSYSHFTAVDCTFSNSQGVVRCSGAGPKNITLTNCSFYSCTDVTKIVPGVVTITNCFFSKCTASVQIDEGTTVVVTKCTFSKSYGIAISIIASVTAAVSFCLVDTVFTNAADSGYGIYFSTPGTVTDCIIKNCSKSGCLLTGNVTNSIDRVLFQGNNFSISPNAATTTADLWVGQGTHTVSNVTSIRSGTYGINLNGSAANTTTMSNCSIYGAGIDSIYMQGASLTLSSCVGMVEDGAVGYGFNSTSAKTITYSVIPGGLGGSAALTESFTTNPEFISGADGSEDLSLSATSDGNSSANSTSSKNCGNQAGVITITATGVEIDGFNISGEKNLYGGIVESADTYNSSIKYCSFTELSFYGIYKNSEGTVKYCLFENNGVGVYNNSSNTIIENNIFNGTSSAGLLNTGFAESIKNNTAFSSPYGQYDFGNSTPKVIQNNIYSNAGVYDYFGSGEQESSCVENLGPDATVDDDSTRLNPLFREEASGDFRLQVVEAGYPYNSPAKSTGADGLDMGAFSFDYGAESESYTEINFATSGYYNPISVVRTVVPVLLAEGDRDDGTLRSRANAYKLTYRLEWGSSSPMPLTQLQALRTLYEADDEVVQMTLDGGSTWIECAVVKSEPFEFNDITGLWAQDDTPAPLRALVLRAL